MGTEVALIGISLALAAAGTGMQMYSANQAANNERSMAAYNAQIAQQQADMQGAVARRQGEIAQYNAQLQMRQADAQRQMSEYQAQMQERNASTLRAYANSDEEQGREQARRMREEKLRILGLQRSQFAKGGVTTEGSPLAVLAETDGTLELQIQDQWWAATNEANKKRGEAETLDWEASVTRTSGDYSSLLSQSAAQMDYQNALFETETASAGVRIAKRQAQIDQMAGNNRANAYDLQGLASGISGAASMSSTLLNYNYNAGSTNRSSSPGGTYNPNASVRRASIA